MGREIAHTGPSTIFVPSVPYSALLEQCELVDSQLSGNGESDDLVGSVVNSKYYDIKKFNSLRPDRSSSFGLLHLNIASLNAHADDLRVVLGRLKFSFDVIGISEHKIGGDSAPSNNIDLMGYSGFEFEPTGTTHGGTGFYVKNGLDYIVRNDLNLNSPGNFEACFIEIVFLDRKKLVVGCIYRYPLSNVSVRDFGSEHLEPILHKISGEKKECSLMGDFNIDLMH